MSHFWPSDLLEQYFLCESNVLFSSLMKMEAFVKNCKEIIRRKNYDAEWRNKMKCSTRIKRIQIWLHIKGAPQLSKKITPSFYTLTSKWKLQMGKMTFTLSFLWSAMLSKSFHNFPRREQINKCTHRLNDTHVHPINSLTLSFWATTNACTYG